MLQDTGVRFQDEDHVRHEKPWSKCIPRHVILESQKAACRCEKTRMKRQKLLVNNPDPREHPKSRSLKGVPIKCPLAARVPNFGIYFLGPPGGLGLGIFVPEAPCLSHGLSQAWGFGYNYIEQHNTIQYNTVQYNVKLTRNTIHTYIHTYLHTYIHTCVYTHVYIYIWMCVCIYVWTYVNIYLYMCLCMYKYLYIYIYKYRNVSRW